MNEFSIDKEVNLLLKEKTVRHRDNFTRLFKARYTEMLPSLIKYENSHSVSVDFTKVEVALRSGYDIIIGETLSRDRQIQVIGYATSQKTSEKPDDLFSTQPLRHGDIQFVIPEHIRMNYYKEISYHDSCKSGNFVVLRNKTLNYVDDRQLINHYISELSEIVLSRFSISMQVKISTLFLGEPGDESLNQIISDIYNGNPYIKGSKLFDPKEQIFHMQNDGLANNFQELKREYQNKVSEMNNILGMNSLAVEKASGVSDAEAQSNRAFTTSNANIYLDARNNGLDRLNKRFGLKIQAMYNDEVVSEFQELAKEEGVTNDDNNPVQDNNQ